MEKMKEFDIIFHRLNGEKIILRGFTGMSSLEDVRRSILLQLPYERPDDLEWFFYGGMPLPDNVHFLSDCNINSSVTLTQYRPNKETMASLKGNNKEE